MWPNIQLVALLDPSLSIGHINAINYLIRKSMRFAVVDEEFPGQLVDWGFFFWL